MKKVTFLLLGAFLTGCGGGGGGGGGGAHPPAISNLQFSPTSASVGSGTFVVNGTVDVTDTGGDIATLKVTTYDLAGNQVGAISTPLSGLAGVPSVTVHGAITFATTTAGVFIYKVQVLDAAGSASNILQGAFNVTQVFSQADITGMWDVVGIMSGGGAGWFRATGTFDGSGNATAIANYLDSTGSTNPGSSPLQWTIDLAGRVSQFDNGVLVFQGKMSSDKKLITFVGTQDNLTHTAQMTVARKRTGTVFSNADMTSVNFTFHALANGTDNLWEYGAGHTNASMQSTITSTTHPSGYSLPLPPPDFTTYMVSTAGIVTRSNNTTFTGLMTDDKKVIFWVGGDQIHAYWFMVMMVSGQTFTQTDDAGIHSFVALRNSAPYPYWAYGTGSIDPVGNGTYLSFVGPSPTPPPYIRYLSSTGVLSDPADPTFHGQMSYNKDINVRTNTSGSGYYGLQFSIR